MRLGLDLGRERARKRVRMRRRLAHSEEGRGRSATHTGSHVYADYGAQRGAHVCFANVSTPNLLRLNKRGVTASKKLAPKERLQARATARSRERSHSHSILSLLSVRNP